MDRAKWQQTVTRFQARARGFLLRTEVWRARTNFEEVVREIDGTLNHLTWEEAVVSFPRFTQTSPPQPSDVSTASPSEDGGEQMEAEKDVLISGSVGGHGGAVMESATWSRTGPDRHCGQAQKDPRQLGSVRDGPHSPEAQWLHRNTLTMELLWIQQAIDSRKKYLSLKDRLSVT